MSQDSLFEDSRVSVTRTRFVFVGVTYPTDAISDVTSRQLPIRRIGPLLLFLIGIPFLLIPSVVAVLWWFRQKPNHALLLSWGGEPAEVYRSPDSGHVAEVLSACKQVLHDRGPAVSTGPTIRHGRPGWRFWKAHLSAGEKLVLIALGLLAWAFGGVYYYSALKTYQYMDLAYARDFVTNGVEVGTLVRVPIGNVLPNGRYWAIVAVRTGDTNGYRILHRGPRGEAPDRPLCLGGTVTSVKYRFPYHGETNLDLSHWETNELRETTSPHPIR